MAVSFNKMSAIKVAGTYINNIASGTSLGNVSLDITGKSHFTDDMIIDGSFNILNINSSNITSNFNVANNQTTGNINIGGALTTGAININSGASSTAPINISNTATGNAPIIIGSTASTTQTCDINAITTFSKIPSTSIAPTTSNHLCNKNYVDSVTAGSVSLGGSNVWTGTNTFNTNLPTSTLTPSSSTELTTKSYVDSQVSGSSILGTANAFTNTNTFNSFLPTSTLTPSSSTQLTTKSYVDSAVSGGSILGTANTFTNTNAFTKDTTTGLIKVSDNDGTSEMDMFGIKYNSLTLANATGGGGQSSNTNLNVATLSVAANNTQSKIRVSIPIVLAAVGLTFIYTGNLTITYSDVYAITILKNGSAYTTITTWDKRNWTTDTRSWTGWSEKLKNASAYFGNIDFYIPISTGNASADTYTIGLAITYSLNANSPYFAGQFVITGNPYFTQTHTSNSVGTTYIGTDPSSFYASQITSPVSGGMITGIGLAMETNTFIDLKARAGIDLEARGGSINIKSGTNNSYTAGDILLKTYGTGDINIQSSSDISITGGNVNISGAITIGGGSIGGITLATTAPNSTITAPTNIAVSGSSLSVLGTNTTTTTRIDGSTIQMRSPITPLYTGSPFGANVALIGSRVVVPFTTSTSSAVTTIYTQTNFPIGVWIIEVKTTFSYASSPPQTTWYRLGTSGVSGSFNDPTRMMDFNPNSSGQQNYRFTTTYQFDGNDPFYVIQQHSGTTITTTTDGSYIIYTRIA